MLKPESRSTQRLATCGPCFLYLIYSLAEKVRESVMGHLVLRTSHARAMTRTSDVTGNGDDVIGDGCPGPEANPPLHRPRTL